MKFYHEIDDDSARVAITGDLEAGECNCLQAFFHCHIDDRLCELHLELIDLDTIDGESIAIMTDIIRHHLDGGAAVMVHHAPQMLAHTLYKIGLLKNPKLTLIKPREEEPYG